MRMAFYLSNGVLTDVHSIQRQLPDEYILWTRLTYEMEIQTKSNYSCIHAIDRKCNLVANSQTLHILGVYKFS
jgi:hypothetical protein